MIAAMTGHERVGCLDTLGTVTGRTLSAVGVGTGPLVEAIHPCNVL